MDAPDPDIVRVRGSRRLTRDRLDRLFSDDDASTSVEDGTPASVGPSIMRRIFYASAVFVFVVWIGVGGALAWRYYGATDVIRAWAVPASTSKLAVPPDGLEIQQQLKSIANNLAAVRHTLEQLSANQDQLTRKQEEMEGKQAQVTQAIATLQAAEQDIRQKISFPPPTNKPVHVPAQKPVQHPAELSTQTSSTPIHVLPPQSLVPRNAVRVVLLSVSVGFRTNTGSLVFLSPGC